MNASARFKSLFASLFDDTTLTLIKLTNYAVGAVLLTIFFMQHVGLFGLTDKPIVPFSADEGAYLRPQYDSELALVPATPGPCIGPQRRRCPFLVNRTVTFRELSVRLSVPEGRLHSLNPSLSADTIPAGTAFYIPAPSPPAKVSFSARQQPAHRKPPGHAHRHAHQTAHPPAQLW